MTTFETYMDMNVDGRLLCLEPAEMTAPYFCYPENARVIGFEGCILYCFLPEYGDMVFASDPESCADIHVYPLAKSFDDFMRLIVACGSANPIEQIVWMDREQFEQCLQTERDVCTEEQAALLQRLRDELGASPMEDPFAYVKALQREFDGSRIHYRDEYYEVLEKTR